MKPRVEINKTQHKRRPCSFIAYQTGEPCKNNTFDSSGLCDQHLRSFRAENETRVRKCFNCDLVEWLKDDKGKKTSPDIGMTRMRRCAKAFWVSSPGRSSIPDEAHWGRDLCYWDQNVIMNPIESAEDALDEYKNILQDIRLRLGQKGRSLANEGASIDAGYMRMSETYLDFLQKYIGLKSGGGRGFGRPGSELPGAQSREQKDQFFDMLRHGRDGYEDGIRITKTESVEVKPVDAPLRAVDVQPRAPASDRPAAASFVPEKKEGDPEE